MANLPVQMSKALGISGFAFHNAAETQSPTKTDCSKFHTMEHVFHSVTHSHTCMNTRTVRACPCAHQTHSHARMHKTLKCSHTRARTHTQHTHARTHKHTHIFTHARIHKHTCMHTQNTHMFTRTHAHKHMHIFTHTRARTHTHTHTCAQHTQLCAKTLTYSHTP